MTLRLYTLSGSPFGWKVQLALDYKGVPYEVRQLSPDKGDLNTPEFRELNPHGKLPVLVDGDLVLSESDAIIAYVDEAFPAFGPALFARDAKTRAIQRMLAIGISAYIYPAIRCLVMAWTRSGAVTEAAVITVAKDQIRAELAILAPRLSNSFFDGELPGAVDFTLFPLIALIKRLSSRHPDEALDALIPQKFFDWSKRLEILPAYQSSYPPHWRDK